MRRFLFSKCALFVTVVLFVCYALSPTELAININVLDNTKDYQICELATATDMDYKILYDSKGRKINYIRINDRDLNSHNNRKEMFNPSYNLNTYVVFPEKVLIDYQNDCMIYYGKYDKKIVYPINRETFMDYILPKSYLCRFETWF